MVNSRELFSPSKVRMEVSMARVSHPISKDLKTLSLPDKDEKEIQICSIAVINPRP